MVAYSFKAYFAPQIEDLTKSQTVRADRARHAQPGDMVQLYQGMRTRHCRRIVPDQECTANLPLQIKLSDLLDELIATIIVNGIQLHRDEIEEFACKDGFHPDRLQLRHGGRRAKTARHNMGIFWQRHHPGIVDFTGRLIRWKPVG
ncbi:ASCH domain-containing protein [Rhizobium ruizarguesonis]|uniref:ASCH domain-containing protein n=1 Tax=Rhizobium ruizarguesonis TaxID=2081791 RepID=UPI001031D51C|nr:ASCH domain-containing protein [Rhizobium ruizarguesonis]TAV99977.1 ASCH domain-containing protein [Rhizobium ruizarguesonis]